MQLDSPTINFTNVSGPIYARWYQRYQLGSSINDFYLVTAHSPQRVSTLFEHRSAAMRMEVGNPALTLEQSTGWGLQQHDLSYLAGSMIYRLRWDFGSDSHDTFAGIAIDDVEITGCIDAGLITPTITPTSSTTPTPSVTPIVTPSITPTPSATPTIDPARFYIHLPLVIINQ